MFDLIIIGLIILGVVIWLLKGHFYDEPRREMQTINEG